MESRTTEGSTDPSAQGAAGPVQITDRGGRWTEHPHPSARSTTENTSQMNATVCEGGSLWPFIVPEEIQAYHREQKWFLNLRLRFSLTAEAASREATKHELCLREGWRGSFSSEFVYGYTTRTNSKHNFYHIKTTFHSLYRAGKALAYICIFL